MEQPCPTCTRPAVLTRENPWRPFCCERCKLVDLDRWFSEDYAIPGAPVAQDDPPEE